MKINNLNANKKRKQMNLFCFLKIKILKPKTWYQTYRKTQINQKSIFYPMKKIILYV